MFFSIHRKDSIVTDRINYDILKKIQDIQNGKIIEPSLLGQSGNHTKTKDFIPPAIQKHLNGCCESKWPFKIVEQFNGNNSSSNCNNNNNKNNINNNYNNNDEQEEQQQQQKQMQQIVEVELDKK